MMMLNFMQTMTKGLRWWCWSCYLDYMVVLYIYFFISQKYIYIPRLYACFYVYICSISFTYIFYTYLDYMVVFIYTFFFISFIYIFYKYLDYMVVPNKAVPSRQVAMYKTQFLQIAGAEKQNHSLSSWHFYIVLYTLSIRCVEVCLNTSCHRRFEWPCTSTQLRWSRSCGKQRFEKIWLSPR